MKEKGNKKKGGKPDTTSKPPKKQFGNKDFEMAKRTQQTLDELEGRKKKIEEIRKEKVVSLDELKEAGYLEEQRSRKWQKKIGKKLKEILRAKFGEEKYDLGLIFRIRAKFDSLMLKIRMKQNQEAEKTPKDPV